MKRLISIFILLLILSVSLYAQDEKKEPEYGWKKQVVGDLNFTQNAFTDWQQGGEDSWSWALNLNAKFENDQPDYNWANSGKFAYGESKVGDQGSRKAADEIKLESVYTMKFGPTINPYAAAGFMTQFSKGYKYTDAGKVAVSNLLDPGYITESIGAEYKPNETIKTRAGLAAKQTITSDFPGYADDPETAKVEDFKNEIGAESVTDLNLKVSERILYESKLEIFSNLKATDEIDVNWDNTFSAKVSELIKVSFNFRVLYDKDIFYKRQLKQTLAVGLSYSFL
ncbi:MAG: DUF3078 domain-containing protein [Calditrichae bacterium]|nr:DUF3078 domain-containing protein [Calditrichota bacterium]MCB9058016.1 DUF3078 domain-containing protein [Calditrichia bacterium]